MLWLLSFELRTMGEVTCLGIIFLEKKIGLRYEEWDVRCTNDPVASKQTIFQHVIYSQGLHTFQMTSPGMLVHKKISKWNTHWLMWPITGFTKWKRTKTGRENILFSIYKDINKTPTQHSVATFPRKKSLFWPKEHNKLLYLSYVSRDVIYHD